MPTSTTFFSLQKPLINDASDGDQWGGYLNNDLDSIDSILNMALKDIVVSRAGNYQIALSDRNTVLNFDASAGNITVTAISPATAGNGFRTTIKKLDASANTVTIVPYGSETFDGLPSLVLSNHYEATTIVGDSINWYRSTSPYVVAPASNYVQGVTFLDALINTTSAVIPSDDTIPQITEGYQVAAITITPTLTTNKLIVEARIPVSSTSGGVPLAIAVFQDTNTNALYTETYEIADNGVIGTAFIKFQSTAGTTSATTFYVRIGTGAGRALTLNGVSGARLYGGSLAITAKVTEVVT